MRRIGPDRKMMEQSQRHILEGLRQMFQRRAEEEEQKRVRPGVRRTRWVGDHVSRAQNGAGKPTTHSKRLRAGRKRSRRAGQRP